MIAVAAVEVVEAVAALAAVAASVVTVAASVVTAAASVAVVEAVAEVAAAAEDVAEAHALVPLHNRRASRRPSIKEDRRAPCLCFCLPCFRLTHVSYDVASWDSPLLTLLCSWSPVGFLSKFTRSKSADVSLQIIHAHRYGALLA